mmetsp:Transcript_5156/g.21213  ORF Transcript_5156/g.21213 Transcript_5156/m.21213 type:complete len:168 (-) Transcript_5156:257-760(-)
MQDGGPHKRYEHDVTACVVCGSKESEQKMEREMEDDVQKRRSTHKKGEVRSIIIIMERKGGELCLFLEEDHPVGTRRGALVRVRASGRPRDHPSINQTDSRVSRLWHAAARDPRRRRPRPTRRAPRRRGVATRPSARAGYWSGCPRRRKTERAGGARRRGGAELTSF